MGRAHSGKTGALFAASAAPTCPNPALGVGQRRRRAPDATRSPRDRGWPTEMIDHLQQYAMASNVLDPRIYLVFLRGGGSPHSLSGRSICRIQLINFTAQLSNTQMAIKKSEIYGHLRATCDELRGDVVDAAPSFITCVARDSALPNDEAKTKRVAIPQQHKIHHVRSL